MAPPDSLFLQLRLQHEFDESHRLLRELGVTMYKPAGADGAGGADGAIGVDGRCFCNAVEWCQVGEWVFFGYAAADGPIPWFPVVHAWNWDPDTCQPVEITPAFAAKDVWYFGMPVPRALVNAFRERIDDEASVNFLDAWRLMEQDHPAELDAARTALRAAKRRFDDVAAAGRGGPTTAPPPGPLQGNESGGAAAPSCFSLLLQLPDELLMLIGSVLVSMQGGLRGAYGVSEPGMRLCPEDVLAAHAASLWVNANMRTAERCAVVHPSSSPLAGRMVWLEGVGSVVGPVAQVCLPGGFVNPVDPDPHSAPAVDVARCTCCALRDVIDKCFGRKDGRVGPVYVVDVTSDSLRLVPGAPTLATRVSFLDGEVRWRLQQWEHWENPLWVAMNQHDDPYTDGDELRILLEYLLPEMRATQAGGRLPLPRNCTFFMDPADWRASVAEGHLSLRGCVQIGGSVNATLPPPYNFRSVLDSATAYAYALNADKGLAAAAYTAALSACDDATADGGPR